MLNWWSYGAPGLNLLGSARRWSLPELDEALPSASMLVLWADRRSGRWYPDPRVGPGEQVDGRRRFRGGLRKGDLQ